MYFLTTTRSRAAGDGRGVGLNMRPSLAASQARGFRKRHIVHTSITLHSCSLTSL